MALVEAEGSIVQAARARGVSPADLFALLSRPAAREALESLRAFAVLRRELRAEALRDELIAILRDVARATPDQAEKRRAASTALRSLDRQPPRLSGERLRSPLLDAQFSVERSPAQRDSVPRPESSVLSRPPSTPRKSAPHPGSSVLPSSVPASTYHNSVVSPESFAPPADEELNGDPEGTFALAQHVLATAQADPGAYPYEAIEAARVYIGLSGADAPHARRPP